MFVTKTDINSKGLANRTNKQYKGRLFGYVAIMTKEKNAPIISSTMYMLMWF